MSESNRIISLIDMDCFYCQVEEKLNPSLKGKPIAVVQYNEWKGGGIIAVNYIARARGVTRFMRGDEAKEKCPDIELPKVPCVRGKADISKYRDAGKDVANVLQSFTPLLERASIDEAYLDITNNVNSRINSYRNIHKITAKYLPNTFVLGYDNIDRFISDAYAEFDFEQEMIGLDQEQLLRLLVGSLIIHEIRTAVYEQTGFECSAGIADGKIMSKLVCGMNKPNKQTILPRNSISTLFDALPLNKIRSLGGKFGISVCETLKISTMKELQQFSEKDLHKFFAEKNGTWLFNIARGIDNDPVLPRFNSKSIGCCKKFAGKSAILNTTTLAHWLNELGDEIEERLKTDSIENNRYPTQMVVSFTKHLNNGRSVSCSRSMNIQRGNTLCGKILAENSFQIIKKDSKSFVIAEENKDKDKSTLLTHRIEYLGISVGKFEENCEVKKIKNMQYFCIKPTTDSTTEDNCKNTDDIHSNLENDTNHCESSSNIAISEDKLNEVQAVEKNTKNINASNVTTLSKQESFFINYLKKTETIVKESNLNNDSSSCSNSPMKTHNHLPEDTEFHKQNDSCNTDDSNCTIDLEINRSLLLAPSEKCNDSISRSPLLHNLFAQPQIEYSNNSINRKNNQSPLINNFVFCTECNKNILKTESEIHSDYHYALSLRQEERHTTPLVSITEHEIKKSKCSLPKYKKMVTISNFFNKTSDKIIAAPNDEIIDGQECTQCGKTIESLKFNEHLDYHEAKKLHLEINKPTIAQSSAMNTATKRKRDVEKYAKDNKKNNSNTTNTKPISSFFQ